MYGADQLSDQISLTTSSPVQRPGSSTVSQTTLPPVEVPVEVPAVSSLPADLSTLPLRKMLMRGDMTLFIMMSLMAVPGSIIIWSW